MVVALKECLPTPYAFELWTCCFGCDVMAKVEEGKGYCFEEEFLSCLNSGHAFFGCDLMADMEERKGYCFEGDSPSCV